MRHVYVVLLIFFGYLTLTNNLALNNLVTGAIVAVGLNALLPVRVHKTDYKRLPMALVALAGYIGHLLIDIIRNGVQVALIVASPKLNIKSGVVSIPSDCKSEIALALSAHAITITPGEMVVVMDDDGTMYTHCLDNADSGDEIRANAQKVRGETLEKIAV